MKPILNHYRHVTRLIAIWSIVLGTVAVARATITVTSTNDNGPGTLRQAIADANPGDTINFATTGIITVTNGELFIAKDLTIQGPGATNLTLDAQFSNRVFAVQAGTVSLSGLRLINGAVSGNGGAISNSGTLTVTQCVFSGNFTVPGHGGGIYSRGDLNVSQCVFTNNATLVDAGDGGAIYSLGKLTVLDCTIQHCLAVAAGGIYLGATGEVRRTTFTANSTDADGDGGAIGNGGEMILADCSFAGNHASFGSGSAIDNGGALIVTNCSISGGTAEGDPGGGAIINGGSCEMINSRVEGNLSLLGGGIYNAGTFLLKRSTVIGNLSFHAGQGIANYGGSFTAIQSTISLNGGSFAESGGGFFVYSGNVCLTNCTLSGNGSDTGGGIHNDAGNVILDSCTVTMNGAYNSGRGLANGGTMLVRNSIVAKNFRRIDDNAYSDLEGNFISGGYNLIGFGDGSTGFTNGVNHDLVGTSALPLDPKVGPLQDNGGPTWTHALLPGSPALDAGHSGGLATDQRGGLRPVLSTANAPTGDGSDIGAFESGGFVRLTSITRTNSTAHLQFTKDATTAPVPVYHIQRRAAFGAGDWADLPDPLGSTDAIVPFLDTSATNSQNFYRVRAGP